MIDKLPNGSHRGTDGDTMSIELQRATLPCQVCGAQVSELRRGRCWACYHKWSEARPVGRGAACETCGERRRDNLRMVELHKRFVPMCHNCGTRVMRMEIVPATVEEIRERLDRERREDERRQGTLDHRLFPRERRVGDRRDTAEALDARLEAEPRPQLPSVEELIFELEDDDVEFVDQTMVRESPRETASRASATDKSV